MPSRTAGERMAIVHPWVVHVRGGEKVFFELARMFPKADLFALHYVPGAIPPDLVRRGVRASFLQWAPLRRLLPYRAMLPLLPYAAESLEFFGYDLVVSSTSGWVHGVLPADGARHVAYVHSPPRYLWSERWGGKLALALLAPLLHRQRLWDFSAAARVDAFLANSETTRSRIRSRYRRESAVVHPPVDIDRFVAARRPGGGYVVAAGELVRYKRFDLAIEACRLARLPLVVVGDGPERPRLERLAEGADVCFTGRLADGDFEACLAEAQVFLHPGIEDFGITTVEALASGTPVVGAAVGGTAEIVDAGSGVLVAEQTPEAYAAALADAYADEWDADQLAKRSRQFGIEAFRQRVQAALEPHGLEGGA